MTLTPTTINRLMLPLWQAGVPRPSGPHGTLTLLSDIQDVETGDTGSEHWCYFGGTPQQFCLCESDATAAERIEFGIDRHSDACMLRDSIGWDDAASKCFGVQVSVLLDPDTSIRLLAKIALAYELLGIPMPKEQ